jgi:hypothetical protein
LKYNTKQVVAGALDGAKTTLQLENGGQIARMPAGTEQTAKITPYDSYVLCQHFSV